MYNICKYTVTFLLLGDCTAKENLTAVTKVVRESGDNYNLTVPELAFSSLKLYCPFVSSFFLLKVFLNSTEIKQTNVFYDSPREDLFFTPIIPDPSSASSTKYQCSVQNSPGFDEIDYFLTVDTSEIHLNATLRFREGDNIQVDLEALCLPFSSRFLTNSDLQGVATNTALALPNLSFTLNGESVAESNLTVAQLRDNGSYSCLVTHGLYEAQIKLLDLYVKPLNVCAHSNGGCEQLCHTDIAADTFSCSCRPGYQLSSNSLACEDVNECLSVSLHDCLVPSQRCENEPVGSYTCECAEGFLYAASSQACEDIDECETGNGDCLHLCINRMGSYFCECKFGYTLLQIDNSTCVNLNTGDLDTPSSLLTPIILALIFGIIFLLSICTIGLLLIAVCKRSRKPTRLKYEMFAKRLSGDFKCHQQVDNPAFRLDQTTLFGKRISPKKTMGSYGMLEEIGFPSEPRELTLLSDNPRSRSLEQAALSDGAFTELDYLSDDVTLPKPLSIDPSPSTLPKYEPQSLPIKRPDISPLSRRTKLPHSNMVPVLPAIGDGFQLRSVKTPSRHSDQDTHSHISNDIKIDQTFC